jgi:membrane-associated phospholipid phosphatase
VNRAFNAYRQVMGVLYVLVFLLVLAAWSPSLVAQSKSRFAHEKQLPLNILKDQLAIWTSPAHMRLKPMLFVVPMGIASGMTAYYDGNIMNSLGQDANRERISGYISHAGTLPVNFGIGTATYAIGKLGGKSYLAETGLLTLEALTDTSIITGIAKVAGDRRRAIDGGDGTFLTGGRSFFSGHSSLSWTTATVLATRYSHNAWVKYPAYGLAAIVSTSRVTSRRHFVSDVLVGGTVGFLIGRYVVKRQGEGFLKQVSFVPLSDRRTQTVGLRISFPGF